MERNGNRAHRIVVTGGPGGGKSTAVDLFRREIGDCLVVVPETATLLFTGGFPRSTDEIAIKAGQHAIYHTQMNNERAHAALYPHRTLLCDRGTVDGAAYWPGSEEEYFEEMGTTLEKEFSYYDAVLFFETAAVGGMSIEGGNPIRNEDQKRAVELDKKLKDIWSRHHNFTFVPHDPSFLKKINFGLASLENIVKLLNRD